MDPRSPRDIERLRRIADRDESRIQWLRDLHREISRELAGGRYGDKATWVDRPYNEIGLIDIVYKMQLIGERPQVLITSSDESLKPFAGDFESVLNKYLEDNHVEDTLRRWVGDALCSIGILRISEGAGEAVEVLEGFPQPSIVHFAANVLIDDFGCDVNAKTLDGCTYMWDRYRVSLDDAQSGALGYDAAVAKQLEETHYEETTDLGHERTDALGRVTALFDEEEVFPQTTVRDFWLPREQLVVTVSEKQKELPALKVTKYNGPKRRTGPYHFLQFDDLPGQLFCRPPLADALDLHQAENESITRLIEQNEGQKTMALTADKDSGEEIRRTPDGGQAYVANPDAVKPFAYPGPDQQRFAFTLQMQRWLTRLMGNIDAMGNLGPNAPTLGQEKLIRAGLSDRMAKMGYKFVRGTEGVIVHLAHLIWHDPLRDFRQYKAQRTIPGTDMSYPVNIGGDPTATDDWAGEVIDYDFRIDPYSSTYQSPAERLMQLEGFLGRIILPNLQLIMAQGGQFNWQSVIELYARYLSMPEYKDLLTFQTPYQLEPPGMMEPRQSPVTERINTRQNIPGTNPQSQDEMMIQRMIGAGGMQEAQGMALAR